MSVSCPGCGKSMDILNETLCASCRGRASVDAPKSTRQKLPARRVSVVEKVRFAGAKWHLTCGFDRAGTVREVFTHGHKSGAQIEALLNDACVMVSILLQHGYSPAEIFNRMGRDPGPAPDQDGETPASFLGCIAAKAQQIEDDHGPDIAAHHRWVVERTQALIDKTRHPIKKMETAP